jgi:type II secretion system protein H
MNTPTYTRPRRGPQGFTLIELLLALTIVGILLSLAMPRLEGYLRTNRIRSVAERLVGDLSYARLAAVREGRSTSLRVDDAGTRYRVTLDDANGNIQQVLKTVELDDYPGLALDPSNGSVTFNSRGMYTAGVQQIQAVKSGYARRVTITSVGRVYLERY